MMRQVNVEDSVGTVLAHDLTKVLPGTFKGVAFHKGYIIQAEDIEALKNMGKYHLWVVDRSQDQLHENEAARRLAMAVASPDLTVLEPSEGKANLRSARRGLLKVNPELLIELNQGQDFVIATLHTNTLVAAGQLVAGAKVIPLVIAKAEVERVEALGRQHGPVLDLKPMYPLKIGIVVTGSEVYYGRIQDRFGELLRAKAAHYGGTVLDLQYAPDDPEFIGEQIRRLLERGVDIVILSGGMAVDADDVTPQALRNSATEVVSYGLPLIPSALGMLAYHHEVALLGLPACAMVNQTTMLDLVLPRLLAKERLTRKDLIAFGHGGFCRQCPDCHYPACSFGK